MSNLHKQHLSKWATTVSSHHVESVCNLYHIESILLPTLSDNVCKSPELRKTYFESFLAKKPICTINEEYIQTDKQETLILSSGIYTFTFHDNSTAQARFTFAFKNINNKWGIIEHHSSLMPSAHT